MMDSLFLLFIFIIDHPRDIDKYLFYIDIMLKKHFPALLKNRPFLLLTLIQPLRPISFYQADLIFLLQVFFILI
ncbi:hypothetical protein A0O21_05510 [Streptococcus pantholopis]|uniref:Uncharacterized protein n=1 Tax=Streptococcus pantholopis TaxID=1811193 RepID=A0A172Q7S7_9STRE|nr:hypothetical protein A0O21_05510 [Streptococcus pantholopis]